MSQLLRTIGTGIVVAVLLIGATTMPAAAQTEDSVTEAEVVAVESQLPNAGILPGNPLYFFKRIGEGIGTFFAVTDTQKSERFRVLAERRLSEARELAEQGQDALAETTVEQYRERIQNAIERAEEAQDAGRNVDRILSDLSERTIRHQEVLTRVLEQVPDQARNTIQRVIERGTENYDRAIERITDDASREEVLRRLAPNIEEAQRRLQELRERGVELSDEAVRKVDEIRREIQAAPELEKRVIEAREIRGRLCAQVITPARNPRTGEVRDFPTPCDVPEGWERVPPEEIKANDASRSDADTQLRTGAPELAPTRTQLRATPDATPQRNTNQR
jgi:hypothetical protein